ncbi:MAG: hypothetical protein KF723_22375 [Rhizobiaceae bacterium]|nr:hypothetical protein [Rhizobiaceae bacterium]
MALTIWKFPLKITDVQDVEMPIGSRILSVAEQHGVICLWALVNPHPEAGKAVRRITIVGTGYPVPHGYTADYIGTVLTSGGDLVWHVFARRA